MQMARSERSEKMPRTTFTAVCDQRKIGARKGLSWISRLLSDQIPNQKIIKAIFRSLSHVSTCMLGMFVGSGFQVKCR